MEEQGKGAAEVIDLLNTVSGGLKKQEDLERLIDIALKNDRQKLLNEIAFTAKFLDGLMGIFESLMLCCQH